jgi:2-keto-4-pentenoate hydratase/2-oxohepta-3-ene-1,7-dioic acid hydratase in catechol pathway
VPDSGVSLCEISRRYFFSVRGTCPTLWRAYALESHRVKLASFHAEKRNRTGLAIDDQTLVDVDELLTRAGVNARVVPRSMLELIEAPPEIWQSFREAARGAFVDPGNLTRYLADEVEWQAPVRNPSKICCLALNNSANAERILSGPKHPAMFVKPASSLIGHGGQIVCLPEYGRTHPEPELAVIIGKRAKHVEVSHAYEYVFGYTIHNDITSPTMRGEDTFHYRAIHPVDDDPAAAKYIDTWVTYPGRYKCADTFSCMGPWLVTREDVPDPHNLSVVCSHQGREITVDNTRNLSYKIPEVIAFISRFMTLLPGDIISMGTALSKAPAGGAVQNIDLNKLGGPVSVIIERLGALTNHVAHQ